MKLPLCEAVAILLGVNHSKLQASNFKHPVNTLNTGIMKKKENDQFPGYPHYSQNEDIYKAEKEETEILRGAPKWAKTLMCPAQSSTTSGKTLAAKMKRIISTA